MHQRAIDVGSGKLAVADQPYTSLDEIAVVTTSWTLFKLEVQGYNEVRGASGVCRASTRRMLLIGTTSRPCRTGEV